MKIFTWKVKSIRVLYWIVIVLLLTGILAIVYDDLYYIKIGFTYSMAPGVFLFMFGEKEDKENKE
jgi:hypothetical protein